jgi:hypothetical protein
LRSFSNVWGCDFPSGFGALAAGSSHGGIARCNGADLSSEALEISRANLSVLGCPVLLERGDLMERLPSWAAPFDLAGVGHSLHHLKALGAARRAATTIEWCPQADSQSVVAVQIAKSAGAFEPANRLFSFATVNQIQSGMAAR